MEFSNKFQLILILFLISVIKLIENTPNELSRISSLCYEESERLVRTPYGFRCVVTKRSNEKRSANESIEMSSQETVFNDTKPENIINNNNNNSKLSIIKEEDLNLVTPIVEPLALSSKYKKIVIKNNRGPWKIANMIFKRSPKSESKNLSEVLFTEKQMDKKDGLLVNNRIFKDLDVIHLSSKSEPFGKTSETVIPLIPETTIEEKFIRNLPKINLFTKTVDKKNLRNFKFNSDIDVIDLMEEDSILQSHSLIDNKTFVVNVMSDDRRKARSPQFLKRSFTDDSGDQIKSDDKSEEPYTPIRIFVFLNRNRKNRDKDWRTESSNAKVITQRTQRKKPNELVAESSAVSSSSRTGSSTTTTTTTTTTTPIPTTTPLTTTTSIPIKRVLKKIDLNDFEDRITSELIKSEENLEKDEEEEDRVVVTTEQNIGDDFVLTSVPVSRNWNFYCGKRKGFFADIENDCRTYYMCSVRGRQRWECPPGTRFNQLSSTCDWLENVNCPSFKYLVADKSEIETDTDLTTTTTPTSPSNLIETSTPITTPGYEPDYEEDYEI